MTDSGGISKTEMTNLFVTMRNLDKLEDPCRYDWISKEEKDENILLAEITEPNDQLSTEVIRIKTK